MWWPTVANTGRRTVDQSVFEGMGRNSTTRANGTGGIRCIQSERRRSDVGQGPYDP
jgi:hypothetical protein